MKGESIRRKIKLSGRRFTEIAESMGITPQALNKILGSEDVKTGSLERIADAMGVPVTYFYDENGNGNGSISASGHAMVANRDVNSEERSVLVLAEQLSTKDKQISIKDQQIDRLLGIIEKLSEDGQ